MEELGISDTRSHIHILRPASKRSTVTRYNKYEKNKIKRKILFIFF